ncbi:MAG: hydroxymethylbilane synthase [Rhodospirillaceae bacterium]|nr:hydroxymethylbilane synthase [Rhodospirillaceae bacterium]
MPSPLHIGTRASPLALWQAEATRALIARLVPGMDAADALPIVTLTTQGDRVRDRPLADLGGKGLFTKDIDRATLDGRVDLAVHSLKDVPSDLPDGLVLAGVLPRADPRDVWISGTGTAIADLPPGSAVGTCSPRRQAQLLIARPDLSVVPMRGNVGTRLQRLRDGAIAGTFLAKAGLDRLGVEVPGAVVLAPGEMLPAVGQGAIALICRTEDAAARAAAAAISCADTADRVSAERAMLARLGGSCHTPIAGLAELAGDRLSLRGLVALPDGSRSVARSVEGSRSDAADLGDALGRRLRDEAGDLLAAMGV